MPNAYIMMHFRIDEGDEGKPVFKGFSFSENPGWRHANDAGLISGVLTVLGYDGLDRGRVHFEHVLRHVPLYQLVKAHYRPELEALQANAVGNAIEAPGKEQAMHRKTYLVINFEVDAEKRLTFNGAIGPSSPGYHLTRNRYISATVLTTGHHHCCEQATLRMIDRIRAEYPTLAWAIPWIDPSYQAHMARMEMIEPTNRS